MARPPAKRHAGRVTTVFSSCFEYQAPAASTRRPRQAYGAHESGHQASGVLRGRCPSRNTSGCWRLAASDSVNPSPTRPVRLAVYTRDPFGNLIELCEPPDDEERLERLPGIHVPNVTVPPDQEPFIMSHSSVRTQWAPGPRHRRCRRHRLGRGRSVARLRRCGRYCRYLRLLEPRLAEIAADAQCKMDVSSEDERAGDGFTDSKAQALGGSAGPGRA